MTINRYMLAGALCASLGACKTTSSTTVLDSAQTACGDVDGDGGDSGNVPDILGDWSLTFGAYSYDDYTCELEGLEQDDFTWFNGNMEIKGYVPDGLYAIFDDNNDEVFPGLENEHGGVVFSGTKVHQGHRLYMTIGGLVYNEPQVDRDVIRGFGYVGVDEDSEDTVIDCWIQGDVVALRSISS